MSDGKNALKLSEDHIDFNLNLKINLSLLFDAETFDFLVSFVPSDISVRQEMQIRNFE